jgi:glyoxylase-like metal-dependent hydrolase (beta-lactamase superfamily II)
VKQEQEEASDEVLEVAPGVLRLQLPIQLTGLRHVNCYALVDDDGATLVDPGHYGKEEWRTLRRRLETAGIPMSRVHTVVITHSHGDHFGGAPYLTEEAGPKIITHAAFHSRGDDPNHRCTDPLHDHDVDESNRGEHGSFHPAPPWDDAPHMPPARSWRDRARVRKMRRRMSSMVPHPHQRVRDGEVLRLANRDWVVRHTPGHTIDHICLHDPAEGVLLSGDHILPTITPHISALGSKADPLAAFFDSMRGVAALGVSQVLPAHGHPFQDLPARVEQVIAHHVERLDKLQTISHDLGWASVRDLSHELFAPRSWGHMAEDETFAHLEHLRLLGRAVQRGERSSMEDLIP